MKTHESWQSYHAALYDGLQLRVERLEVSGYGCSRPANYLLAEGRMIDGRKIGYVENDSGSGMFAAVSPMIGEARGAIRVYGGEVSILAPGWGKEIVIGPQADVVEFVRRYAQEGEWLWYTNEGAEPHHPEYVAHLRRMADLLEALDIAQFPARATGPAVRRPYGLLRD